MAVIDSRVLRGQKGTCTLESVEPFTFGRVAMLFRARGETGQADVAVALASQAAQRTRARWPC